MPKTRQIRFDAKLQYDPTRSRHFVNGVDSVLHCHHYATLYTQLADDATLFDGKSILRSTAEHTFLGVLQSGCESQKLTPGEPRFALASSYWSFCGMGNLEFAQCGENGGTVEMTSSHLDEGWIRKWGKRPQPVNFITQGFLAAAFSAAYGRPEGSYVVAETRSIVTGAEKSVFSVTRK